METFFSKFPKITYNNIPAVNLTKRAKFTDLVQNNSYIYYPYMIESGERLDQIAENLYDDPYLGWIICMSNGIIDPYNELYMNEEEFNEFILKKYGTQTNAENLILYFRTKIPTNEDIISKTQYETLFPIEYKYWEPIYENEFKLLHYKLKDLKWEINTNFIIKYELSTTPSFKKGDRVNIIINPTSSGKGTVIQIIDNTVWINSIEGEVYPHNEVTLNNGSINGINIISVEIIKENLSLKESKYWEPISAYKFEYERNEYNKTIRILDKNYISQTVIDFKKVINE